VVEARVQQADMIRRTSYHSQ